MKYLRYLFIILSIFLSNCSRKPIIPIVEIFQNTLTREFSFGSDDLPRDFQMKNPQDIEVFDNGDILVCDDARLKVFNNMGKPKRIVGGPGLEPGEFEQIGLPHLSQFGYLSVFSYRSTFNIFDSSLNFKKIHRFEKYKNINDYAQKRRFWGTHVKKVIAKNVDDVIILLKGPSSGRSFESVLRLTPNEIKTIASYEVVNYFPNGKRLENVEVFGRLMLHELPGNQILYTNTQIDRFKVRDQNYYKMTISDFEGKKVKEIIHSYSPVDLPENPKGYETEKAIKAVKNYPYLPPVVHILVDENYIFAFTYQRNSKNEYKTDIFSAETGNIISSAWFPFIPQEIKNEKVYYCRTIYDYELSKLTGKMPYHMQSAQQKIEVYKIDPKVYGK